MSGSFPSRIDLIVGLGNPGPSYQYTRHNVGFWFADAVVAQAHGHFKYESKFHAHVCKCTLYGHECWVLKPETFMNVSGRAVAALATYYKIPVEHILVAHDDLDLPPGSVRLKQGGGDGGHNGLKSLSASLGSNAYLRLRVGIGHPGHKDLVSDYVLGVPTKEQAQQMETAIAAGIAVLPMMMQGEFAKAIQHLHTQK